MCTHYVSIETVVGVGQYPCLRVSVSAERYTIHTVLTAMCSITSLSMAGVDNDGLSGRGPHGTIHTSSMARPSADDLSLNYEKEKRKGREKEKELARVSENAVCVLDSGCDSLDNQIAHVSTVLPNLSRGDGIWGFTQSVSNGFCSSFSPPPLSLFPGTLLD